MVAVKSRLKSLRAGFVLPMSLVATFITLMIVGASATYCTTQFRTSQEYLNRTRCRLVAQSAIELAKLELYHDAYGGMTTPIADPTNPGANNLDISSKLAEIKAKTKRADFLQRIPGYGPGMSVSMDIKAENGINRIYATAVQRVGSRSTSVTLQENFKIPISDANIFLYAYFANGDGHLMSQYLTINGDVRANRDFYLSGAEINGFIYASNEVHIVDKTTDLKDWWDGKDVTIRKEGGNPSSYNQKYRSGDYAKARPTDPIKANTPWAGGFKEANDIRSRMGLLEFIKLFIDWITGDKYDNGVVPICKKDRWHSVATETTDGEKIVKDGKGLLGMPRIALDKEPETALDRHLQYYKEYAAKARTPQGKTGGSLICSNCFVSADGKMIEQLSVKAKVPWIEVIHHPEEYIHHPAEYIDHPAEYIDHPAEYEDRAMEDRSRAAGFIPADGVPVYDCLPADEYADKLRKKEIKAEDWLQLKGDHSDDAVYTHLASPAFVSGYEGTIPAGNHAGTHLFFEKKKFNEVLTANFGTDAAFMDDVRIKFKDDKWSEREAEYSEIDVPKTGTKGTDVLMTKWITVYGYSRSQPYIGMKKDTSWTSFYSATYYYNSTAEKCFKESDLTSVKTAVYNSYGKNGITKDDVEAAFRAGPGWSGWNTRTSGYWKGVKSYLAFSVLRHYEPNKPDTYEVVCKEVSGPLDVGIESSSSPVTYTGKGWAYSGIYYSSTPAGYVQVTKETKMIDQHTVAVDVELTRFDGTTETITTYEKLLETKLVPLYTYTPGLYILASRINGYINRTKSGLFEDRVFRESQLNSTANEIEAKYGSSLGDRIRSYFSDENDGWESYEFYDSIIGLSSAGYLAIRIVGLFDSSTSSLDYDIRYDYLTSSEADRVRELAADEKIIDVRSVPLYDYSSSSWGRTRINSDKWYRISSSSSSLNNTLVDHGEIDKVAGEYAGNYGLSANDVTTFVANYLGKSPNGWTQWSGQTWYRSNDPTGFLTIKILWSLDNAGKVRHRLECEYSSREWTGSDLSVDSDSETVYVGTVPDHCVPVYQYISTDAYNAKNSKFKANWTRVASSSGYYNARSGTQLYGGYFLKSDFDAVVSYYVGGAAKYGLKASDLSDKVLGSGGNWTFGGEGYRSKDPMGYVGFDVAVTTTQVPEVNPLYAYLSVAGGEGTFHEKVLVKEAWKEKTKEAWQETIKDAWDEKVKDAWDEEVSREPKAVARPLRRIFVKDGYKVIADTGYRLPGATASLVRSEDLVLSAQAGDTLKEGDTTAKLRPFMEDEGRSNKKTAELGTGGKSPDEGAVILIGTWDFPITIDGPVVFESDVIIRGFVTGRGTIYSGRNIHIIGDINYKNPPFWPYNGGAKPSTSGKDMLVLVSRGSIVFGNYAKKVKGGTTDDCVDESWKNLLNGNYINAVENRTSGSVKPRKFTEKNYTQNDPDYKKVVYDRSANRFEVDTAKYYESVVGDYVFVSEMKSDKSEADENRAINLYGCSSLLSQHWDCNVGNLTGFRTNVTYQSGVIEEFANNQNWKESDRAGLTARSFSKSIWDYTAKGYTSQFGTFCRNNYASGSSTSKKSVKYIQAVNAVVYSSQGIYGVVGGQKTPCVINGAIIGQDEALLPYARQRRSLFGTISDGLDLTINWDIRLDLRSEEAKNNHESDDDSGFEHAMKGQDTESGDPDDPRVLSWQEVPDSFNEEYHATP